MFNCLVLLNVHQIMKWKVVVSIPLHSISNHHFSYLCRGTISLFYSIWASQKNGLTMPSLRFSMDWGVFFLQQIPISMIVECDEHSSSPSLLVCVILASFLGLVRVVLQLSLTLMTTLICVSN